MSVERPAMGRFVGYVIWHEKEAGVSSRTRGRAVPEIAYALAILFAGIAAVFIVLWVRRLQSSG